MTPEQIAIATSTISQEKRVLENSIRQLLTEFSQTYGVIVSDVDFEHIRSQVGMSYDVQVQVTVL
jgi:hypothetical protein